MRHIRLTDGGVYDNLGLEPVWKRHRTVLVSDGGGVFRARTERTVVGRTLRILGIATNGGTVGPQPVAARQLSPEASSPARPGRSTPSCDGCYPRGTTELINAIRTDLDAFSQAEQHILERHGYLVADAQVRAHCPELVTQDSPAAAAARRGRRPCRRECCPRRLRQAPTPRQVLTRRTLAR